MRNIYKMNEIDIKINGRHRISDDGILEFNWSASGFEMNFEAEIINVCFCQNHTDNDVCYMGVYLDGVRIQKFPVVTGTETLMIEDIPSGEHHLKLVKLSEGNKIIKIASVELIGDLPKVLKAPEYPCKFEFLGDSITCGFGDIAERGFGVFRTRDEDVTKTYAYLTAAHFNADIRIEAYSGQGIVRNCNGIVDYPIPHFFSHRLRKCDEVHDFESWIPNVLVINAGTNDNGGKVTDEEFFIGAENFLTHVVKAYPQTQVIWLYGMMGLKYEKVIDAVVKKMNNPKIHFLPVAPISAEKDEVGAIGHPNEKGQKRAAESLIMKINEILSR